MSFLLTRAPSGDNDPIRNRETGGDIQPRDENILFPDTIPVPFSRFPKATRTTSDFIIETTVPNGPVPGTTSLPQTDDDMTFIPAPNVGGSGLTVGGPVVPGGSGPTFPDPGGFTPQGGSSLGGALGGALEQLINRGAQELGDRLFGGSEAPGSGQAIPGSGLQAPGSGGPCPGIGSVRLPDGRCINLGDLGPGGAPAITPQQATPFTPVMGLFGVGVAPLPVQSVKRDCPPGFVLGKDNICYDGLPRSKRKWNPGRKPLLTGGEMNAITKATRAARRLESTKKSLKKTAKALKKVC